MNEATMIKVEACIKEIRSWMSENFLILNDLKTEFIISGTPQDIERVFERSVSVGDKNILPSMTVRNIGAMLDSKLTMECHIYSVIKNSYHQIRTISRIRFYLKDNNNDFCSKCYFNRVHPNNNSTKYYTSTPFSYLDMDV